MIAVSPVPVSQPLKLYFPADWLGGTRFGGAATLRIRSSMDREKSERKQFILIRWKLFFLVWTPIDRVESDPDSQPKPQAIPSLLTFPPVLAFVPLCLPSCSSLGSPLEDPFTALIPVARAVRGQRRGIGQRSSISPEHTSINAPEDHFNYRPHRSVRIHHGAGAAV
jgi:hypothetical protein